MTPTLFRSSLLFGTIWLAAAGALCGCAGFTSAKQSRGDRVLVETTAAARDAFEQERTEQAAALYKFALQRARAMDQPLAIGDASYNLAACLLRLGQYDRVRILLDEASYELERGHAPLADVLLLGARAAHLSGDSAAAATLLRRLRTDPGSRPSPPHLAQAALLEGHMACDRRDWMAARSLLRQARAVRSSAADPLLQAQVAALTGRVAVGTQEMRIAAEAFDRQADLLRRARQYRVISAALARAAEAYATLREHDIAADRFYRAARSAAASGDTTSAKKWASAALAAAQQAGDPAIIHLIESLICELTTLGPEPTPVQPSLGSPAR